MSKRAAVNPDDKYLFAWNHPVWSDRVLRLVVVSLPFPIANSDEKKKRTKRPLEEKMNVLSIKRRKLSSPPPTPQPPPTLLLPPSIQPLKSNRKRKRPKWTIASVRAWKRPLTQFLRDSVPKMELEEKDAEAIRSLPADIYVNSMLIAKHSTVLRTMLDSKFLDGQSERVEIALENREQIVAFVLAIKFLYSGSLPKSLSTDSLIYVFMMAVQFDIAVLLEACVSKLADSISQQKDLVLACGLLTLLENLTIVLPNHKIHEACADLFVTTWPKLYHTWKDDQFLKLPFSGVVLLLENKHKLQYATENSVYQVVRQWIKAQETLSIEQLGQLADLVRWQNLSANFFLDIVKHDTCFQSLHRWTDFLLCVQECMLLQRSRSAHARKTQMIQAGRLSYRAFSTMESESKLSIPAAHFDAMDDDDIVHSEERFHNEEDLDAFYLDEPKTIFADGYMLSFTFTKFAHPDGQYSIRGSMAMNTEKTGIQPNHPYYFDAHWRWEFFLPEEKDNKVPQMGHVHVVLTPDHSKQEFELDWSSDVILHDENGRQYVACIRPISLQ